MSAGHHLDGTCAHPSPDGDPLAIPRRAFALWSSQHDSGRLRVTLEGERSATFRVEGYDSPSEEMRLITDGCVAEVIGRSGLGDPHLEKKACRNRGDGVCGGSVRWA